MALPDQQDEGLAGPSAVADEATETRRPLPGLLLNRAAWMGLGALVSVVVATAAFTQAAWTGGTATDSTTNSLQAERAKPPAVLTSPSGPGAEGPDALVPADSPAHAPAHSRARKASSHTAAPHARHTAVSEGSQSADSGATGGGSWTGSSAGASLSGSAPAPPAAQTTTSGSRTSGTTSASASTAFLSAGGVLTHHSDQYWDEDTVTVRITAPVTALEVSVRIVQTGGVRDTGAWSSLGDEVTIRSAANSSALSYVVTLNPGITLSPGTYTFSFGFNHNKGLHNAGHDVWAATATAAGSGRTASRSGHFS